MDGKVLNLLIERVEKSAMMYVANKNEAWLKCLEDDKKRLKEYCLKKPENIVLPDFFKFMSGSDPTTYYALKTESGKYRVSWSWNWHSVKYYPETDIKDKLTEGLWVIVN